MLVKRPRAGGRILAAVNSLSMEKLRRVVSQIANTPSTRALSTLSPLQLSLIPLLSFASSLYRLALSLRSGFYGVGLLPKHRLPVPVISVGNLTWGGNGKTPMVEYLALWFANSGISPLILTRGYGGADEAKMLQRHLQGTSAKIGVGADRAAAAAYLLGRHGYLKTHYPTFLERLCLDHKESTHLESDKIGAAILDDGMQHLSLWRDLEIVMINGMMPWGNHQLIPLGPLREPLTAVSRADVVVVHHADLVSELEIKAIESAVRKVNKFVPIYYTRMAPSYFFKVGNVAHKLPLDSLKDMTVLCVSAIGFSDSFVHRIEKMRPIYADRLDFNDHHSFQTEDIHMIRVRLQELQFRFACKPVVVVTEKDYDREPKIFTQLDPFDALVLCSKLQIIPLEGREEDGFKTLLKQLLQVKMSSIQSLHTE